MASLAPVPEGLRASPVPRAVPTGARAWHGDGAEVTLDPLRSSSSRHAPQTLRAAERRRRRRRRSRTRGPSRQPANQEWRRRRRWRWTSNLRHDDDAFVSAAHRGGAPRGAGPLHDAVAPHESDPAGAAGGGDVHLPHHVTHLPLRPYQQHHLQGKDAGRGAFSRSSVSLAQFCLCCVYLLSLLFIFWGGLFPLRAC